LRKIQAIRKLTHILFTSAVFFLLLHNITPHLHHGELNDETDCDERQSPEGLLDFLALSFHFDLGEGHLEYFPKVNKTDLESEIQFFLHDDLQPSIYPIHLVTGATSAMIAPVVECEKIHLSSDISCCAPLRGPPRIA